MRQSRFDRHPVGCGPFVFDEWKSDQFISLKRFDNYWEGPPNYQRYVMRIIPDLLTQEMEFYSGTLDSYNVQPHQVERLILCFIFRTLQPVFQYHHKHGYFELSSCRMISPIQH